MAPTPSGHLHLGNVLAFGAAFLSARSAGVPLLLRIEDLDRGRARDEIAQGQRDDLRWLGLEWDQEVPPQSTRRYPLDRLDVYRCDCPRWKRLARQCTCRDEPRSEGAWRFRVPRGVVEFEDRALGPQSIEPEDDPIVTRADGEAAYPLAVVMDDHRDGVTEVVRGADLLSATAVQIRLYEQLGVTPPTWLHTPMILGPDGKKLSKSHGSAEVRALRAAGVSAAQVWGRLRRLLGDSGEGPCRIEELVAGFMPGRVMRGPVVSTPERSDALLPP